MNPAVSRSLVRAARPEPAEPASRSGCSLVAQVPTASVDGLFIALADMDIGEGRAMSAVILVGIGDGSGPGSGCGPGGTGGKGSGFGLGGLDAACFGGTLTSSALGAGISSGNRSGSGSPTGLGSVSGAGFGKSGDGLGASGFGFPGSDMGRSPFRISNCRSAWLVPDGSKSTGDTVKREAFRQQGQGVAATRLPAAMQRPRHLQV